MRTGAWLVVAAAAVAVHRRSPVGALLLSSVHQHGAPASATAKPGDPRWPCVGTTPATSATNVAPSTIGDRRPVHPAGRRQPDAHLHPAGGRHLVGHVARPSSSSWPTVRSYPGSTETLTIPGGPAGLLGADGQRLAASTTVAFTVAPGSTLRLQQLLAQLGYLPVTFTPASQPTSPQQEADPQQGTFTWRWADQPASLTAQWTPGHLRTSSPRAR